VLHSVKVMIISQRNNTLEWMREWERWNVLGSSLLYSEVLYIRRTTMKILETRLLVSWQTVGYSDLSSYASWLVDNLVITWTCWFGWSTASQTGQRSRRTSGNPCVLYASTHRACHLLSAETALAWLLSRADSRSLFCPPCLCLSTRRYTKGVYLHLLIVLLYDLPLL